MRNPVGIAGLALCMLGSVLVSPAFAGSATAAECDPPDCWGAIATSDSTHHWGYSYNDPSQGVAEAAAMRECDESDCAIRVSFADSCGAVATSADWVAWGHADTRAGAESEAMAACRGAGCHIQTWACTSRT